MIPVGMIINGVKGLIPLARGFGQLIVLLGELSPVMVKLWRQWQRTNGRLSGTERKRLTETVREAVKTKNTTDLEAFLTGKPSDRSEP